MVALVIGLVSVLATTQLFLISEGQKRTITGGGDAQTNGAFALYSLQRDIRQGGYGVSAFDLLGCKVMLRTGVDLSEMAPVNINPKLSDHTTPAIPAGDANTDTLLVVYGDGNGASEGNGIVSATSPNYTVQTPTAFLPNDRVIALPQSRPDPCALLLGTVSAVSASTVSVANWVNNMANGTLFNLGRAPKILAYAIRGGNLTVCDYLVNNCGDSNNKDDATVWVPIVSSIVSLRAEYGRDTNDPMDTIVRCV